ncbi:hypothetical protein HGA91_04690 [candidate division WWE3 bacterium]|nr:hypothetical protein [candidate division WWE3 bacterium]
MSNLYQRFFIEQNVITKLGIFYFTSAVLSFTYISLTFPFFNNQNSSLYKKSQASANQAPAVVVVPSSSHEYNSDHSIFTVVIPYSFSYSESVNIYGTVSEGYSLSINNNKIDPYEDQRWDSQVILYGRDNVITITAFDNLGNEVEALNVPIQKRTKCDINEDEAVDRSDIELINGIVSGLITPVISQLESADCNQDGIVNSSDISIVTSLAN